VSDVTLETFVHRFVPGADPTAGRTLLLLHGTGGDEQDLIPLGRMLDPGAALLSPRGRVLEAGMPRYFRRLADGVFDLEDLRARTAELAAFVRVAAGHYGFPAGGLVAAGFSNGANIAASLLLLAPGTLAGAILFRPMVPTEPEPRPDLAGVPVLIAAGRSDPIVPPAETQRLAALLRAAGADVTVHGQAGGHSIARDEVAVARDWLADRIAARR
jgi:phospholipase/carboxylesterase/glyoxalase family protein